MAVIQPFPARGVQVRDEFVKRNWASREPGPILVFCIVFIVGVLILALIIQKSVKDRREERAKWEITEIKD
ncbi:hypothetical protein N7481_013237 [Penicillium waksmanii]|uniref:uncharacterized protein n=1 Tax=Penicillium waksmanii TaxID=69791 RepID=UPI002547FB44|nr:uncharacterized protein N7481_013237 [Penicillium waksmanii]KAJ5966523.1 hypothetical protein N7481_013237 [Penicillium waksmanii]